MKREPIDKTKLGNTIREAREGYNWTQERLAEYIGEPVKSIVDIESGKKKPTIVTLFNIAEALGYTADDLVNYDVSIGPFGGDKEVADLFWDTMPREREILVEAVKAAREAIIKSRPLREKE